MAKNEIKGHTCSNCESENIESTKSDNGGYRAVCSECGSIEKIPICNLCGSYNLNFDEKRAELSCRDCGIVLMCPIHYVGGDILVRPLWAKDNI